MCFSKENEIELKKYIEKDLKSTFISTPFSERQQILNKINVPFSKLVQGVITTH